jgi:hypothetical protein
MTIEYIDIFRYDAFLNISKLEFLFENIPKLYHLATLIVGQIH